MERQKFEESFREAFQGAEVAPSDSVWINVELDLEKTTGGKMKRRLLFFQLLAAASMVFAMGIGSVYYLNNHAAYIEPVAQQSTVTPKNEEVVINQKEVPSEIPTFEEKTSKPVITVQYEKTVTGSKSSESNHVVAILPAPQNINVRPLPALVKFEKPVVKLPVYESAADPGMVLLARLKDEEKKYQATEKQVTEKIWTSFGIAAGSYNPNVSSTSDKANSFGASSSNPSSGSSYSLGVSVAGKIGRRLVLQGGISYLTNNAEYTSSAVSASGTDMEAALNEYATANSSDEIVASSPYQVNSNLQYVSIPLQAGYIIVDRAFAIQLNGGISTDLFIQSTLTPNDNSLDKVTQGAGDDSPYRTVNFSGLVGTELSYKVGEHYRIAVNPGLRYALNPIYKSEIGSQTSPITFDVGLRFRYIFN